MKETKYTSVYRIIDKLSRDLGFDDSLNESDIIEWIGEALSAINAFNQLEEAIAFIEVKNYTACIPNGLYSIIQLAKNNCFNNKKDNLLCPIDLIEEVEQEESPIKPIFLDCNGSPLQDYELAYYRPYFDLQYGNNFSNSNCYNQCFTPIRLSSNNFFGQEEIMSYSDEYKVIAKGEAIRFSFENGQIALAYTRPVVDDNGYPMIPDNYSYTTAITKYITYKLMERRFYRNEKGSESRLSKSESDWHWYCSQAGNYALQLKGEDDFQDVLEQRQHLLPKLNNYYSFFGKMNRRENRIWNDSNYRNNNYFRGNGHQ